MPHLMLAGLKMLRMRSKTIYAHGSAENPFPVLHIAKAKEKSSVIESQSGGVPPLRIQATSGVYWIML